MIWERLGHVPWVRAITEEVDPGTLAALEPELEWFCIESGTVLFAQGEHGSDCYLLASGRLGVLVDEGTGSKLVGSVGPGGLIGEMAVLTDEPRSATVTAYRDSELIRFPAAAARRLMDVSRTLTGFVIRQLSDRLRTRGRLARRDQAVQAVAVIPLDRDSGAPAALADLRRGFVAIGRPLVALDESEDGNGPIEGGPDTLVLHEAGWGASPWHRRCVRQSDRIVYLAQAGTRPDAAIGESVSIAGRLERPADLVLVHPAGTAQASGAAAWLGLFAPDHVFHVHEGDADDHARVARMVMGCGTGLVLSGGGARGFAHLGVIRALADLTIPIDHICGTSMGALIGASAAHDRDPAIVAAKIHHGSVANNPFGDFTLPIIALARGRRMSTLLKGAFGEARIEDTWTSFSCVSSNLTTGRTNIHQSGPIWRALRASAAIPGVVPPVVENGEVLVDGGIMNNLPVDVMRSFARGPVIGVEVSTRSDFRTLEHEIESRPLHWMLGAGRGVFPNIFRLMFRCATVGGGAHDAAARDLADLVIEPDLPAIDMLSFKRFEAAVEAGYAATLAAFDDPEIRARFVPAIKPAPEPA